MWRTGMLALLLAAVAAGAGYHYGSEHTAAAKDRDFQTHLKADRAAELEAERQARAKETALENAIAAVDAAYQQGKQEAQRENERLVADLRSGAVRLRDRWQQCEAGLPDAAPGTGGTDAGADDRAASAARIIRAARDADERIKALQEILRAERSGEAS